MKYKQSSIFSNNEKIDCRNLCLYFNFKDEKTEDIIKLINLIDINLIQKFEDDFVFDIQGSKICSISSGSIPGP